MVPAIEAEGDTEDCRLQQATFATGGEAAARVLPRMHLLHLPWAGVPQEPLGSLLTLRSEDLGDGVP